MNFALSTSWNAARLNSAQGIIKEIKALGFDAVEASFNLSTEMVDELAILVHENQINVVSVHNFCPVPKSVNRRDALPDYYSMASLDEAERKLAVKQTKLSIDTAKRLRAKVLVLHCGRVEIPDRTKDLMALYDKGQRHSGEFQTLRDSIINERSKANGAHFTQSLKSLREIADYAREQNINLGIENRVYYREIPNILELKKIFSEFKENVFYWHDTGHAEIFEKLGFIRHKDYLDNFKQYLIGVHIHDVEGTKDHKAPLEGELDFNILKTYLKKDTLKVIEAHYPASPDAIINAKGYLEKLYK